MSIQFQHLETSVLIDSGDCSRNLNLLAHAQMIELDIGSQCGGHGKCGADRVQLGRADEKKVNPPTEVERIHLSNEEIAAGYRLACQCFPNEDGMSVAVRYFSGSAIIG